MSDWAADGSDWTRVTERPIIYRRRRAAAAVGLVPVLGAALGIGTAHG